MDDLKLLCENLSCKTDIGIKESPKTITLEEFKNLPIRFSIELENKNPPVLTHISEKTKEHFLNAIESDDVVFPYSVFLFEYGGTIDDCGQPTTKVTIVKRVIENRD